MKISKKILSLVIISLISVSIFGCSKTKEDKIKSNSEKYNIYEIKDVESSDQGITQTIEEVGVFNNMTDASKKYTICKDVLNNENKDKVTVVVKFKVENNNDFTITNYTSVRPFVTNTGEVGDLIEDGTYDVDIDAKQSSEGYAVFNLVKTKVDELNSLKMWWIVGHNNGTESYDDDYCNDNKFNIELK